MSKHQFNVETNPECYEPIRQKISENLSQRYSGWNDGYDRQFDVDSRFFMLTKEGETVAGTRVIVGGGSMTDVRLPAELADRPLDPNLVAPSLVCEVSGFWFSELRHALALCALSVQWIADHLQNAPAYVIYDPQNRAVERVYLQGFGLTKVAHPPIVFDSFTHRESGAPVEWTLTIDDPATRRQRIAEVLALPHVQPIVSQL